jgi:hypothetical protein
MLSISLAATFAAPIHPNKPLTTFLPPSPTPDHQPLKPLVLLTIYNPWLMVIGSDEPTFALYDNGLVIYQRIGPADAPEFASVQLTAAEFKALKAQLKIDKSLYALDANKDYYTKTDQPTNVIRLFDPLLGEKLISIYGDLNSDPEARQMAAPQRLIDLYDTLVNYSHPDAQTWLPDKFEVMLWSYDTSDAVAWPSDWPTLTDPTTVKRDSLYSFYIDIKDYDRYLELRQSANAVRLDGKNWAFSARFPLPHELAPQ